MHDFSPDLLVQHPGLRLALGAFVVLCLGSTFSVGFFLIQQWRQHRLTWDQLQPLPIPLWATLGFLTALAFLIAQLGGAFFPALSLTGVLLMLRVFDLPLDAHFGLGRIRWIYLILAAPWIASAAYLPLQLIAASVNALCVVWHIPVTSQPAVALFEEASTNRTLFALFFLAVIAAPVCEESLFRGFLQPALKHYLPSGVSLLTTGFIFAALHGHGPTLLPLFALGCLLGSIYEITGSLPLCVGVHASFNALTTIGLLTLRAYSS